MARTTLRQTTVAEVQHEAEWTRRKLAELLGRVSVVEQLYYLAESNQDARQPFEMAVRQLGEDAKQITEDARIWGLGSLAEPSEAMAELRLVL
jgi:septation ring formation regulator EzrA